MAKVRIVTPEIEQYADAHTTPSPAELATATRRAEEELWNAEMVSGFGPGRFLETLVFSMQARTVLEIGTYGGTAALWLARSLPVGGKVITCEIDERAGDFARQLFDETPGGDRIELRMGPAIETIATLDGPLDLVFIDADKKGYVGYLEAVLPKLSPHGLVVADNTLRSGLVLSPEDADEHTQGLLRFNERVLNDPALVATVLTVRDGMTLVRKA